MDNLTNAMYMAFSIFTLILALAVSLALFRKADETAKVLMQSNNKYEYIERLDMESFFEKNKENIPKLLTTRIVSKDTIIPVLYRYPIESLTIKIYDKTNNNNSPIDMKNDLEQLFFNAFEKSYKIYRQNVEKTNDMLREGQKGPTDFDKVYKEIFDKPDSKAYLYNVPWANSPSDVQQRVEYYINGIKGFINGVEVDYTDSLIAKDSGRGKYKEIIIEYPYNGEVRQELDFVGNQVYLENEVIQSRVKDKNTEIIYIKISGD